MHHLCMLPWHIIIARDLKFPSLTLKDTKGEINVLSFLFFEGLGVRCGEGNETGALLVTVF